MTKEGTPLPGPSKEQLPEALQDALAGVAGSVYAFGAFDRRHSDDEHMRRIMDRAKAEGRVAQVAEHIFEIKRGRLVDQYRSLFAGVDFNAIAHSLVAKGNIEAVADGLQFFPTNLDNIRSAPLTFTLLDSDILKGLVAYKKGGGLIAPFDADHFAEFDEESAIEFIKLGNEAEIANGTTRFKNLQTERVANAILDQGELYKVLKTFPLKSFSRPFLENVMKLWLDNPVQQREIMIPLNRQFTPPLSATLDRFVQIAGTYPAARLMQQFSWGKINEPQLRNLFAEMRAITEGSQRALEGALTDENLRLALESYLRVDSSDWGSHDDTVAKDVIARYLEKKDTYAPLPEAYAPGTLEVAKIEHSKINPDIYTPEFKERWETLLKAINAAGTYAWDSAEPLTEFTDEFGALRERMLAERREDIASLADNPKLDSPEKLERATAHANAELSKIEQLPVTPKGLMRAFDTLFDARKTKELNKFLLVCGLAIAMRKQDERDLWQDRLGNATPSVNDISKVIDFVTHIAHHETWEKSGRFADKKSRERLNQLFHVKALEDQLAKMQKERTASKETITMTVRPSRDVLTEFSGHMADACWASRYEILERPNISSLSFFTNGQVAGSCLLIDAENIRKDGEPEDITIIRGLNPLESVINKLDPESFMKTLIDYLAPIAEKRGRKLAIVIDDHAGGAATNRPLLYNYLRGLRQALKKVNGLYVPETEFNGYDISHTTFEISPSSFSQ